MELSGGLCFFPAKGGKLQGLLKKEKELVSFDEFLVQRARKDKDEVKMATQNSSTLRTTE